MNIVYHPLNKVFSATLFFFPKTALSKYTTIFPPEILKFLVTFLFSIVADPVALTITPSTPPENDTIASHPALNSHPSDIVSPNEALSLTDEPDPEVTLTAHEIVPLALALIDTRGKAGKANLNIVIVLLQLPLRDTPV